MSLYELDWPDSDELVETLYFPSTLVDLVCDVGWCNAAGSSWVTPSSGSVTDAEMAMVVNWGYYEDGEYCQERRSWDPEYNCIW